MGELVSLRASGLYRRYGGRAVVSDVSLEVRQGEIVGLLGPNGAGKTTTFYMIVGLVRPHAGHIYMDEQELTAWPIYKRARAGIGYLPQEASIFRNLSVSDNLLAVLEMRRDLSSRQRQEELERLLEEFRLTRVRRTQGRFVSGGERRRTEIARCLAANPRFIMLDEPFAGIDPIAVEEIQQIVLGLRKRHIGIFITDHNVGETLSITDSANIMFEGKLLKSGSAESLARDPQVRKLYLGTHFELKRKT